MELMKFICMINEKLFNFNVKLLKQFFLTLNVGVWTSKISHSLRSIRFNAFGEKMLEHLNYKKIHQQKYTSLEATGHMLGNN